MLAAAFLALLVALEIAARMAFDFPLYNADDRLGYWVRPDQRGEFLFTNDWAFNSDSLGVAEEFHPSAELDVLLVGDSIVLGGNPFKQGEKLGPVLAEATGWQVWPASAGSWALQNQLEFLRRKPHLVEGADIIVFVLNSSDFVAPSAWQSEFTHPRQRPGLYLHYLVRRYLLKTPPSASPRPVAKRDVMRDWAGFVERAGKPVVVVAYAAKDEVGSDCSWLPSPIAAAATWSCFDPGRLEGEPFSDGIHLKPWAVPALARSIELAVLERMEPRSSAAPIR